jgi:DNA ligase (NAD+)
MKNSFNKKDLLKDPIKYVKSLTKRKLDQLFNILDKAYHSEMDPLIPDKDYELINDWYLEKYPNSSKSTQTGHKISKEREKVKLPYFMPSLIKIAPHTRGFDLFLERSPGPLVLADKEDGISLVFVYIKGVLTEAYTRGNGTYGQDVSKHIPYFNIPKRIGVKVKFAIRTEAIMSIRMFNKKFSKEIGGDYTAERNLVGSTINSGDGSKLKFSDVLVYEILEGPFSTRKLSSQLKFLKKHHFNVVFHKVVEDITSSRLSRYYESRTKLSKYAIDGIVVSQDVPYTRSASMPEHARKFKENSATDMREVIVDRVLWEVSKGGKYIPVVIYKKTNLGGVSNTRATGHNAFFIINGFRLKDKNNNFPIRPIGPGSVLQIVRSGNVIPHIVSVIKSSKSKKPQMPESKYKLVGADAFFIGKNSNDITAKRITHFFVTLGVDGLKLASVKKLMENGYDSIRSIIDSTETDLSNLPGVGQTKAKQWTRQIKVKLKQIDIATLADSSSLFIGFSKSRLDAIFGIFPNSPSIKKWSRDKILSKISLLGGYNKLAVVFVDILPKFIDFVEDNDLPIRKLKQNKATGSKFKNLKITFTGIRDKDLQAIIEQQGGKVQNMKSDTSILVIKDSSYTSSKISKASDLGIKILTLDEFKKNFKI